MVRMDKKLSNDGITEDVEKENITVETGTMLEMKEREGIDSQAESVAYRHRFFHTACVCFSMFSLGWRNGLVGPTFPDLRLITNEDLSTASWIFTAISFGGLIGSVSGGFAYDRFNKIGVFVFIVCGLGIASGVAPWCSHFAAMFAVHVFHGAFASALDTAATADVTVIWRHKSGPFMQAVHATFSVGAILSPFVSEPFLAKKIYLDSRENSSSSSLSHSFGYPNFSLKGKLSPGSFFSVSTSINTSKGESTESSSSAFDLSTEPLPTDSFKYGESFIYIPYFSATVVCALAASLYFIVYRIYGNVYNLHIEMYSFKTISHREYFLSKKMKILFTILLALTLMFYIMSERSFIGFLMTFIITELRWSKASGSSASATFWIAFAAGRLSGIVIVKCFKLSVVIMIFFVIVISGAVLFWLAVISNINSLVWVSIAAVGYGMSVIFASIFLWLSENVRRLTGKMASILFIFFSSGAMVFPILVGQLMDKVSQMWFIYLQLIIFCAMCAMFLFILVLFDILKKRHEYTKTGKLCPS